MDRAALGEEGRLCGARRPLPMAGRPLPAPTRCPLLEAGRRPLPAAESVGLSPRQDRSGSALLAGLKSPEGRIPALKAAEAPEAATLGAEPWGWCMPGRTGCQRPSVNTSSTTLRRGKARQGEHTQGPVCQSGLHCRRRCGAVCSRMTRDTSPNTSKRGRAAHLSSPVFT